MLSQPIREETPRLVPEYLSQSETTEPLTQQNVSQDLTDAVVQQLIPHSLIGRQKIRPPNENLLLISSPGLRYHASRKGKTIAGRDSCRMSQPRFGCGTRRSARLTITRREFREENDLSRWWVRCLDRRGVYRQHLPVRGGPACSGDSSLAAARSTRVAVVNIGEEFNKYKRAIAFKQDLENTLVKPYKDKAKSIDRPGQGPGRPLCVAGGVQASGSRRTTRRWDAIKKNKRELEDMSAEISRLLGKKPGRQSGDSVERKSIMGIERR